MNKVVLFDAVGTILKTSPGVIEVYHSHGLRHGSALNVEEIKVRFKVSRRRLFDLDTSAQLQTAGQLISSDDIERSLWFQLIADVFMDVADPQPLFDELWQYFANPDNWQLFHDTASTFEALKSAGCLIGIASNFDSRLNGIVGAFPELHCADFVFCSAGIGFRKPDPAFYAAVETKIQQQLGREVNERIWMTGDCIENDFWGPRRHGWNAVWLDRTGKENEGIDQDIDAIESLNSLANRLAEK